MTPADGTTGGNVVGSARPTRLKADNVEPDLASILIGFNRLIGHRACCHNARQAGNPLAAVARYTRGLCERSTRAGLDDPQIDTVIASNRKCVDNDAAIDPDHGQNDTEQKAQTKAGQ